MKQAPTAAQIQVVLDHFIELTKVVQEIKTFMDRHVENPESFTVYGTLKRYENKVEKIRQEFFEVLRREFPA